MLSIITIGALAIGLIWVLARTVSFLQPVLLPFAIAGVLAYLLEPVVGWLCKRKIKRIIAVGIVFANAISLKMTGLATPALVAVESFFGLWFLLHAVPFTELLLVLVSSICCYVWWFAVAFTIMIRSGPNKVEQEFMTPLFQATLIGSDNYDPSGRALAEWRATEGLWWTTITHNARMIKHNANILEPHHWQSAWWEWIADLRGVAYYGADHAHGYATHVYLIGNHVVLWATAAAIVLAITIAAVYLRYKSLLAVTHPLHTYARQVSFCIAVYVLNLLPYVGVARSTFIYHYLPALVYGQIIFGRLLDLVVPRRWRGMAVAVCLVPMVAAYLFLSPWIYALPLQTEAHDRRRIMPRWN